ncbi:MAG: shikimate dehydrogenase [Actinomycetota bacterium]|nr:shikimate dehydrogenase [Actinomycetota bacterium]
MPIRCAVLGKPIEHSLSPVMHRAAYSHLGLDWTYDAIEVAESELEGFLAGCDDTWRGLSLTMPLKREVIGLADEVTKVARILNVANTLEFRDGRMIVSNTDCTGALAALAERGVRKTKSARIIGGGATAASIAYALASKGLEHLEFVVRNPDRADEAVSVARDAGVDVVVRQMDKALIDVVDLLVSTVPGEAIRQEAHNLVDSARAVFDVVYDPWPTPLAKATKQSGVPLVSGLDLLAHQASFQVELMTGSPVEADLLRQAALAELATR